ncbi:MAG: hypothetical protein CMI73_03065 [Candidatus Pelagibacter sp.]|nr:hypothetical protein [Candidatus Pelagibacter sp.]OUV87378.1 MAG: hypothetical protein CBC96_02835 [Pelagibacteraceae bacterium TMED136]|tara:strand:+ start:3079 stop:3735 length:657 start_codon:yes stop_codon:yes gene_type:complete
MTEQQIFNFDTNTTYLEDNFIKDSSNIEILDYFLKFPNWENKLINLFGVKKSGKTFLLHILKNKKNFFYLNDIEAFEKNFEELFLKKKLIVDNISISENKLFSLINHFIQHNKYLVISSTIPLTSRIIMLKDLKSRLSQFHLLEIKNPSDNLVYSLILKYFSDNQVNIRKELIQNIVKKIDRSYPRINTFLSKLNNLSIVKKKKIDYKLINQVFDSMV